MEFCKFEAFLQLTASLFHSHCLLQENLQKLTGLFCKVPPKDNIDRVPLGASSASMYPGYSPADHIYGEAAQEYGAVAAELKRKGIETKLDPSGPQYIVGQSKKPRRLSQEPEQVSPASKVPADASVKSPKGGGEPMEGVEQFTSESQYFIIDSKPTSVTDLGEIHKQKNKANDKVKRRVSFKEEQETLADIDDSGAPKLKKAKVSTTDSPIVANVRTAVEEEDISAEVDARLKAKEEKRKRKEKKKRKRESADSTGNMQPEASATMVDDVAETALTEKSKEQHGASNAADVSAEAVKDPKSKKDKKKKKKADADGSVAEAFATSEPGEPKKKRKKLTTISI